MTEEVKISGSLQVWSEKEENSYKAFWIFHHIRPFPLLDYKKDSHISLCIFPLPSSLYSFLPSFFNFDLSEIHFNGRSELEI